MKRGFLGLLAFARIDLSSMLLLVLLCTLQDALTELPLGVLRLLIFLSPKCLGGVDIKAVFASVALMSIYFPVRAVLRFFNDLLVNTGRIARLRFSRLEIVL